MSDPESNPKDIALDDADPIETREWLEALDAVKPVFGRCLATPG